MSYNRDIKFVIGALAHGMDFDDAFALVEQAKADRETRQGQKAAYMADLAGQAVQGVDPAALSSYAELMAPSYGVKRKGVNNALDKLGAMGEWSDLDDEAFFNAEGPLAPMELISKYIDDEKYIGEDGLPDRAAIRGVVSYQTGVKPEQAEGFNDAFDRAFDMHMAGRPDYDAYREKVAQTKRNGGSVDTAPGTSAAGDGFVPDAAEGPLKALGITAGGMTGYGGLSGLKKAATGKPLPKIGVGGWRAGRGVARTVPKAVRGAGRMGIGGLRNLATNTMLDPSHMAGLDEAVQSKISAGAKRIQGPPNYSAAQKLQEAVSKYGRTTPPRGVALSELADLNLLRGASRLRSSGGVALPPSLWQEPEVSYEDVMSGYEQEAAAREADTRPWYKRNIAWDLHDWLPGI